MANYKYLSDGRKVSIVGKINQSQFIVQEIYVDDSGNEIPAGENFVVTSVLDSPLKTWKEKQDAKQEDRAKEIEKQIKELGKQYDLARNKARAAQEIVKSNDKLIKYLDEQDVDTFVLFLTGSAKWLVDYSYTLSRPVDFVNAVMQTDSYYSGAPKYEGIKLMSVYGRSDGSLSYQLNQYRDGTGGSTKCFFFAEYQEAVDFIAEKASEKIKNDKLSHKEYTMSLEIGITFDPEDEKRYQDHRRRMSSDALASKYTQLQKLKSEIQELESVVDDK